MIKKLTITDFEAHKKTELSFGPGLNVIHGKSNNGKSASLRAIELAAYGVWAAGENKKKGINGPVRVGAKLAEVTVESDKGSVTVRRGKGINEWEISNSETGEELSLQNPGSGAIDQAQDVLGLRSVEIAGAQIRFNWSDQRDKHFLIEEVEGKNSSPSFVAGVLDEVGGLSGCEDLVRDLASDKGAFEKVMKDAAERSLKIDEELVKFSELDAEIAQHSDAEDKINRAEKIQTRILKMRELSGKIKNTKTELSRYDNLDEEMAQTEECLSKLREALEILEKSQKAIDISRLNDSKLEKIGKVQKQIEKLELLDLEKLTEKQEKTEKLQKQSQEIRKFAVKIDGVKRRLESFPEPIDFRKAARVLGRAEDKINTIGSSKTLKTSIDDQEKLIKDAEANLKKSKDKYKNSKLELESILDDLDICPTCGQEVTAECKAEMIEGA
jgi:exonuclease SbcC